MLRLLLLFTITCAIFSEANIIQNFLKEYACSEVPREILEKLLGPAYNSRYMSIQPPKPPEPVDSDSRKRKADDDDAPFYSEPDFMEVIDDRPAWEIGSHTTISGKYRLRRNIGRDDNKTVSTISRRQRRNPRKEWKCPSEVVWTDLGLDYFPRYIRSVECLTEKCWYGACVCKPQSFTMKLLRRKKGLCVKVPSGAIIGDDDLPSDLAELWVWEERAVTFCCDCSFPDY